MNAATRTHTFPRTPTGEAARITEIAALSVDLEMRRTLILPGLIDGTIPWSQHYPELVPGAGCDRQEIAIEICEAEITADEDRLAQMCGLNTETGN